MQLFSAALFQSKKITLHKAKTTPVILIIYLIIYLKSVVYLAIEIFKVIMGISPIIMKEILKFIDNNNYNLRIGTRLSRTILHTTHYGTESITNLGAKLWEVVHQNIKEADSLSRFKLKTGLKKGYQKITTVIFVRHI